MGCPICSGKLTALQIYNASDKTLDDQLCTKHIREQLEMMRRLK